MSKKFVKSIIGNIYTYLTVEDFLSSPDKESWWKCRCKCGRVIIAHREELVGNQIKSCGCMRKKNILYKTFGRLFVVEFSHSDGEKTYWKCLCICGKSIITTGNSLRNGSTKSCGCYRLDQLVKAVTFNGFSSKNCTKDQIRFRNIWNNMKQRCFNPKNDNYPNYGGRGVTVCSRWLEFKNFVEDLWESYLKHVKEFGVENTTLGHQVVDGNYKLSNVKWETLV